MSDILPDGESDAVSDILLDGESGAVLAPYAHDAWVEVREFAIHILKTGEGVVVNVYVRGCEDLYPLACAHALDEEAKAMQEEEGC